MSSGSVYLDTVDKLPSGNVIASGRLKIGNNDTVKPDQLGMRLVRSFQVLPSAFTPAGSQESFAVVIASGSIGSLDTINTGGGALGSGNYVRVRKFVLNSYDGTATLVAGTGRLGTSRMRFMAIGI